jgi:hypothetical protein
MNYLDEFGLSDDDIKAIDEGIEEANKFFAKVSLKDFFIKESTICCDSIESPNDPLACSKLLNTFLSSSLLLELLLKDLILQILDSLSIK